MGQEFYVNTDDGAQLYGRIYGEGMPLLMIHGSSVDSDLFIDCAKHLAEDYRVITYDRRGYTRSTGGQDFSIARQAKDAAAVLDYWHVTKAFVVACSAGGLVGLKLATSKPDIIEKLIMHETPFFDAITEEEDKNLVDMILESISAGKMTRAKYHNLLLPGEQDPKTRPMSEEMLLHNWENGDVFLENEFMDYSNITLADVYTPEVDLKGKVGMGIGEGSGGTLCTRTAKKLAEKIDCPIFNFPGYHNSVYDHPKDFAATIKTLFTKDMWI